MLDELIKEGRLFRDRIAKHYDPGFAALAPEDQITVAELDGWYKGVTELLETQFGADSAEAHLWRTGLDRVRKESWERVGEGPPRGTNFVMYHLEESLGLLAQVRILQFKAQSNSSDTARTVAELLRECEAVALNVTYADDLLASLRELQLCFDSGCHIACLALCGKLLEIALKQLLINQKETFDDGWMIGKLLTVVRDKNIPKYLDPSLRQIGEIINRSRIPAVHSLEKVPVPSREQAAMAINATIDTIRRTLIAP